MSRGGGCDRDCDATRMSRPPFGHSGIVLSGGDETVAIHNVARAGEACMLGPMHLERRPAVLTHGYGLVASRGDIAAALHEWHTALATANASVEAEIYACAAALIMEFLEPCATLHDLLDAYYCPGSPSCASSAELCTGGEIPSCIHECCCGRPAQSGCATLLGKPSPRWVSHDVAHARR